MNNGTAPTLDDLVERVRALETGQRPVDLVERVVRLETAQRAENLAERVRTIETAQRTLGTDLRTLERANITDQEELIHEHAAHWLRMVNTNVWTLNSIFLVGSIIAFSNAQSATLHWKHTAGWIVLALSIVWFFADFSYTIAALRARGILARLENRFAEDERLYTWQTTGPPRLLWFLSICASYLSMAGVAYIAVTNFIQAK